MGFRFRKSIKIIPGVKLNVTKNGISSVSVGKRGASVNIGKKGVKSTVGIPGTGLSYQTTHTSTKKKATREHAQEIKDTWIDNKVKIKKNSNIFVKIILTGFIILCPFIFSWFTLKKGYSNVSRCLAFSWMFFFIIIGVFSDPPKESINNNNLFKKVLNVSEYYFTINNKQAVSINCGRNKDNFIEITIAKSNIKNGYKTYQKYGSDKNINASATINKIYFCLSSKHETFINFSINKINKKEKTAEIIFSGRLVSQRYNKFIEVKETKVIISGNDFYNLTK